MIPAAVSLNYKVKEYLYKPLYLELHYIDIYITYT